MNNENGTKPNRTERNWAHHHQFCDFYARNYYLEHLKMSRKCKAIQCYLWSVLSGLLNIYSLQANRDGNDVASFVRLFMDYKIWWKIGADDLLTMSIWPFKWWFDINQQNPTTKRLDGGVLLCTTVTYNAHQFVGTIGNCSHFSKNICLNFLRVVDLHFNLKKLH